MKGLAFKPVGLTDYRQECSEAELLYMSAAHTNNSPIWGDRLFVNVYCRPDGATMGVFTIAGVALGFALFHPCLCSDRS